MNMPMPVAAPPRRAQRPAANDPSPNAGGGTAARARMPDLDAPNRSGPVLVQDLKRESGIGLPYMRAIEMHHAGDPLRQLDEFFRVFQIPAATGRKRAASKKSHHAYRMRLRKCVNDLTKLNMRLQNVSELSRKHVEALTRMWEADGASTAYMMNINTALRRLGIWLGKPDMVPVLSRLVSDPAKARLSQSATVPKTLMARNVSEGELFTAMDAQCAVAGLQLRIMLAFGLRVEETVMFRPFAADRGTELFVEHGTKGGRPRFVPLDTPYKRDLIEQAKAVALGNPKQILTDRPRAKFHQARRRFYYLAGKIGLTKGSLGVTPHGLRHEFANRRYLQLTGFHSPVHGGPRAHGMADRAAREVIVDELGHGALYKTSAYLGSSVKMAQFQRRNLERILASVRDHQGLRTCVQEAGIRGMWLLGQAAEGLQATGQLVVAWATHTGQLSAHHEQTLSRALAECLGARCGLVPQGLPSFAGQPTLEIV